MEDDLVRKVTANPKYQKLVATRTSYGWILTIIMMVVYYGYIAVIAFDKELLAVRLGEREQMLTMEELKKEAEIKRMLKSEQRRSVDAAELEAQRRYEEYAGVSWGKTSRKPGRPRKTPDAAVEKKILAPKSSRKIAA